jgi:2-C-methyl-D-erythritol 4-phosphate cytidylyltransferase
MGRPKALAELAGRPLWRFSVDLLGGVPAIERVVLATPPGQDAAAFAPSLPPGAIAVPGGTVRSESVRLALAAAGTGDGDSLVLVHDAARPLLTAEIVQATLAAAGRDGVDGAIAAAPVTDTIKQADADRRVLRTLDRAGLWAVQTPQVFRRGALERALAVPAEVLAEATDDAWLIERAGGRVVVVPTPRENLKVTTQLDLQLAELLLAGRRLPPAVEAAVDVEVEAKADADGGAGVDGERAERGRARGRPG